MATYDFPHLTIFLHGGIVQDIWTDGERVSVTVVDGDTEGMDTTDLVWLHDDYYHVYTPWVQVPDGDNVPTDVLRTIEALEEHDPWGTTRSEMMGG
jgi:hypothetical protein